MNLTGLRTQVSTSDCPGRSLGGKGARWAVPPTGLIAQQRGNLDEAEADFTRMAEIYRSVYNGKHYYIGVALGNLASVYMDRKLYVRAEQLFREALQQYAGTLPAEHENVGVGRISLGRALLRQNRFSAAESESRTGYEILLKQSSPSQAWLHNARTDLAEEYAAMRQPEKAEQFRAELAKAQAANPSASVRK
jgi:tetratricopeptide (TPR) repeat protein